MNANTKITEQKLTEAFWHDYQDLTFGQILELVQDAMSAAEKKPTRFARPGVPARNRKSKTRLALVPIKIHRSGSFKQEVA